ncbi:MAG: hypothetical protein EA428_15570 [Spirochaetaceae bacterium]|nr:MAG: hypothetical protein EA428_15570 [Spirochaetaceae bacterium]
MSAVGLVFQFLLVNNLVLYYFVGMCPALEYSRDLRSSLSFGAVLSFVLVLTAMIAWFLDSLVLQPLGLTMIRTFVLLLLIAGIVQGFALGAERIGGAFAALMNEYLPLFAANCAVFGLSLIVIDIDLGIGEVMAAGIGAGFGVMLVLVLLSAIREHMESEWIHPAFRGTPIVIISAGLMAMAFHAFDSFFLSALF